MKPIIWTGCYDASWKGAITNASFAHPAKMSRGLLERIIKHGFEMGYWQKGDRIGDCFGGVGTTGIVCAYNGLEALLCELEPKFIAFANDNFALHRRHWEHMGLPLPRIIQGDSRKFDEYVAGIVSSPPYADSVNKKENGIDWTKAGRPERWGKQETRNGCQAANDQAMDYGDTDGQIGSVKSGAVDSVISSPPYANISPEKSGSGVNIEKQFQTYRASGGGMDGVVSSPPFGQNVEPGRMGNAEREMQLPPSDRIGRSGQGGGYGDSPGQIGDRGDETYWQAVDAVYRACFRCIRPGGVIVLVVKDYCAKGKRVRLCDDTLRLLEHIGFQPLERIHAMLVTETVENGLFGEERTKRQRKSFFRRLYEAKLPEQDERRIDHEEVLICRRP